MNNLIAIAVVALICSPAFAGDKGPLPQTGKDHPGVTNGATENGAMETKGTSAKTSGTTGLSQGASAPNGSPSAPPTAKQGPQGDPSKSNDTPK